MTRSTINIVPTVMDFGGQSVARLQALSRAGRKISDAVAGGMMFAQIMTSTEMATLKEFVAFAEGEFALAEAGFGRNEKPDEQHSPDGYSHFLDLEKL